MTILAGDLAVPKRKMIREIEEADPLFRNIPLYLSRHGLRTWEASARTMLTSLLAVSARRPFRSARLVLPRARCVSGTAAGALDHLWPRCAQCHPGACSSVTPFSKPSLSCRIRCCEVCSPRLFVAAIPEEFVKLAILVGYNMRHHAFDEPMDGIVYGVVASLGFATLENMLFVFEGGISVAVSRAFTAVPLHAFVGAIMGYYVGRQGGLRAEHTSRTS